MHVDAPPKVNINKQSPDTLGYVRETSHGQTGRRVGINAGIHTDIYLPREVVILCYSPVPRPAVACYSGLSVRGRIHSRGSSKGEKTLARLGEESRHMRVYMVEGRSEGVRPRMTMMMSGLPTSPGLHHACA